MKTKSWALLLISILFLVFCSKPEWNGKKTMENNVQIINNLGAGLWKSEQIENIRFNKTLSLGVEEGEDHLMFRSIYAAAVDSDMNIFILDGGNQRILKFDKDGHFIWQAGRKGQGPGEFQYPSDLRLSPEDRIAVMDSPSKISFFDQSGSLLHEMKLRKSLRGFQFIPDGRILASIFVQGQPGLAAEYYDRDGIFLKEFPDNYLYGPKLSPNLGASIGGEFLIHRNTIYLTLPDRYEIREYGIEGNLHRKILRDFRLNPPNIEVLFEGRGVRILPSDSNGPCFIFNGKILINSVTKAEKTTEKKYDIKRFLDLFNEKGQYLATVRAPENAKLTLIDGENNLYFNTRDPYPYLIRYSLNLPLSK